MANKIPNDHMIKMSMRIEKQLNDEVERYLQVAESPQQNKTAFIGQAIRFYLGYLQTQRKPTINNYLIPAVTYVISNSIKNLENRLGTLIFKIDVEISMLSHIVAYAHIVDDDTLRKLRVKCIEEVKATNGFISFESANRFQQE